MQLSLNGPLPRLLAPGIPDWIGTDGSRVGWIVRDRLFLLDGGSARVVELPDHAEDAVAGPDGWHVALGNGVVRIDATAGNIAALLVDDEADPVAARPGADVMLFVEVPEHRLLRMRDGKALPLPDAALRARHIRPWSSGLGACWVDFDTLYRLGERISALGRAPGAEAIACGPQGAVMVALKADTVLAAPRGLAVRLGRRVDVDSARFAPDGLLALAADEHGVVLVDLRTGTVERTWSGSLAPVGFAPDPVLLDVETGRLLDAAGRTLLEGFAGSTPGRSGDLLAGPGGALWRLGESAVRVRADLADGACATDGTVVVYADARSVRVFEGAAERSSEHGLDTADDPIADVRLDAGTIEVRTLDGEVARLALADLSVQGRARPKRVTGAAEPSAARSSPGATVARDHRAGSDGVRLPAPDGASVVRVGDVELPIPADAAASIGARAWLWTEDGMLVEAALDAS
jgi:hypothetical protein